MRDVGKGLEVAGPVLGVWRVLFLWWPVVGWVGPHETVSMHPAPSLAVVVLGGGGPVGQP